MKKYYTLPLLLVLVPSISACQDTAHSIVAINNMGSDFGVVEITKAGLLNLLANKQQFVLEQYSPTCSHCEDLKPILEKYAKSQKKIVYRCNMFGLTNEEFNEEYQKPYPDVFSDYYVPRIQFINQGKLTYEVNSAKFSSYYGLKSIMDKHFFSSKIYMVQTAEDFAAFKESHKDYVFYMYDQEDSLSTSLAAAYIINNEIAKAKKPVVLLNYITYTGNIDAIYQMFEVEYYAFASLVKNNEIIKTIDYSTADGSELNNLLASL